MGKPNYKYKHTDKGVNRYHAHANHVVIARIQSEPITAGGIVLPDSAQEKPNEGYLISVGDKVEGLAIGERVLFANYAGQTITTPDGTELVIVNEEAELVKIDEGARMNEILEQLERSLVRDLQLFSKDIASVEPVASGGSLVQFRVYLPHWSASALQTVLDYLKTKSQPTPAAEPIQVTIEQETETKGTE